MDVTLAKVLHLVGLVLWLGGGAAAALMVVFASAEGDGVRAGAARAARRLTLAAVTPGMLAAWAGGLYMLLLNWSVLYSKAPWMHTKLLVGLVATGISGVLTGRLRRASAESADSPAGAMKLVAVVLLFSAVAGATLVTVRFGG